MSDEERLRHEICDIGRRIYARHFVAGNAGNISCRLSETVILSTPTLSCKGFMQPDDLCTLDLSGRQLSGPRPVTSEIRLHLEVYNHNRKIQAVVHCHPPHATAFAITGEKIPSNILPEVELFLGAVPITDYETPGSEAFAESILPHLKNKANTIVLANHGAVAFDKSLEQAYFHLETLDAYCRILILSKQIGPVRTLSEQNIRELMEVKKSLGLDDPRLD